MPLGKAGDITCLVVVGVMIREVILNHNLYQHFTIPGIQKLSIQNHFDRNKPRKYPIPLIKTMILDESKRNDNL